MLVQLPCMCTTNPQSRSIQVLDTVDLNVWLGTHSIEQMVQTEKHRSFCVNKRRSIAGPRGDKRATGPDLVSKKKGVLDIEDKRVTAVFKLYSPVLVPA